MSTLALLFGLLVTAAGPQLDANASLAGAVVGADTAAVLPHAKSLADVLDVALVAPVSTSYAGGGIDLFDPMWISVHGYSWTQLRHRWGEVPLDDPAAAGQPLLQLPLEATAGLLLGDAWAPGPQLVALTPTLGAAGRRPVTQLKVHGAYAHDAGDASWMAPGLFDRDPAFAYGAPRRRRALAHANEARAAATLPVGDGTLLLLAEHLEQTHRYLAQPLDRARRDTAVLALGRSLRGWPLQLRLAFQRSGQSAAGAAFGWPAQALQRTAAQAWVAQVEASRSAASGAHTAVAFGLGLRRSDASFSAPGPRTGDLLGQWLWLARPTPAQASQRFVATGKVRWSWPVHATRQPTGAGALTEVAPANEVAALVDAPPAPAEVPLSLVPLGTATAPTSRLGGIFAVEIEGRLAGYDRGATGEPIALRWQGQPVVDFGAGSQASDAAAVAEAGAGRGSAHVAELRGQMSYRHVLRRPPAHAPGRSPLAVDATAGLVGARLATPRYALGRLAPSLGVAVRAPIGRLATFVALRREPEAITSQLTDAVGGGSSVAAIAPHLQVPAHHLLQLGLQLPLPRGWSVGARGTLHVLRRPYVVRARPAAGTTVGTVDVIDPGGDGRGERWVADGHQHLSLRTLAQAAIPGAWLTPVLANNERHASYYGVELEVHSPADAPYFVDVQAAAYLSKGEAPFGNGADRNDPGILAPSAIAPNADVHSFGRYDHDRSFALKVQAGIRPVEGLSLALAGRYRDGQPFARLWVPPNLPQGPEAVQTTGRGGARYTFRMLWDVRLRYASTLLRPFGLTVMADVYNLLGSATEIAEDPRTGPSFRRALEAIPGRSAWVGLELAFLP